MSDVALVTQDNLLALLEVLKSEFLKELNAITVFSDASTKIAVLNNINTTGDGSQILADNGTYVDAQLSLISTMEANTNKAWSVLNMTADKTGNYYPNISTYGSNILKADNIITSGDGTKFLNNAGNYVDVTIYGTMADTDVTSLCNDIIGGI
jgi:hypothetical protein